jgi:PIN domain nuclease of toxin-antitoxin system
VSDLLLDTCAFLWVANGDRLTAEARKAVAARTIHASPITAWEFATLMRKGKLAFSEPLDQWFRRALDSMGAGLIPLTPDLLIQSQLLPGNPPSDPAVRIVIAAAREANLVLVTRDSMIVEYARHGFVRAMEC